RSARRDVETILEPDTELAVDHDRRLVAEAHPGLDLRLVAADEIRPLVAVEPDTVSRAMRQTWRLVVGAEARGGDHLSRCRIDRLARCANLGSRECRALRALLDLPDVAHALRRLAEHRRPRDVGCVALYGAPGVDQHHVPLAQLLRLDAAVRKRRVFAEDDERAVAVAAELSGGGADVCRHLLIRHARLHRLER